jgi:hypothetical protein
MVYPGLGIPKELYSGENKCALFCAHPLSKTIAPGSSGREKKAGQIDWKNNTIADHRKWQRNRTPQLLTEGLLIRI